MLPEASTATAALTTGEVDFTTVPSGEAEPLRDDPGIEIHAFDTADFNLFGVNQDSERTELFTDVRVRQALMSALDRDLIAEEICLGFATRADGTQPPLSIAYAPDSVATIYDYDPDRACHLLDEAGWVEGEDGIREKDGVPFRFECLYGAGIAIYEQQLPYMQQAWREVGLEMQPVSVPLQTLATPATTKCVSMASHGASMESRAAWFAAMQCRPPASMR
ncbi:MAG TPA: ABC transporter substrate-binding protein [Thermomicrobiales bacterium]|nr:ABC transporter substrate-binding protein [Thermomicrobiales bacterium]